MTEYKEAQIIKHALRHYINRPDADEKDVDTEKILLNKYEEKVERLKCRNRIK
ncbi:hypothetical protein [Acetobacterium wieringae]|uniref:hypothetical protein n=1 Tax=Acetobacterium wieringae TaxID=52694 RepID=UPI00203459A3|nr:hypothetical protein [Acetobacterium wieringae]URN85855.1 hypothetical protein CHL1_001529 [Acetobacterium wieringae]